MNLLKWPFIFGLVAALAFTSQASAQTSADGARPGIEPISVTKDTDNKVCLDCHGVEGFAVPTGEDGHSPRRHLSLNMEGFSKSSHGEQTCVACHTDIKRTPHKKAVIRSVDCIGCHKEVSDSGKKGIVCLPIEKEKWEKTRFTNFLVPGSYLFWGKNESCWSAEDDPGRFQASENVGKVVREIGNYLASIHAQPKKKNPDQVNATCVDCHSGHYTFPMDSKVGQSYRMTTPAVCGRCHEKSLKDFGVSVHGIAAGRFGNKDAAVCADCHTAHEISSPKGDLAKLAITENCGDCHKEQYDTYRATYHGQVTSLGYTHTAKCFDCHEPHVTQKIKDKRSKVSPKNKLKTCNKCHKNAPVGFLSFNPHGNTHDFEKYPYMWIASKSMIALLIGVFAFFWTHSALWFHREYKDRKEGKAHVLVNGAGEAVEVPKAEQKHVRRFSWPWRLAHLILALAVMSLVLTGTMVLYADSFWAPVAMKIIGGPVVAAIVHRVSAVFFAIIFLGHIIYALDKTLIVNRKTFRWFGPYSLLPRWQDFTDFWNMLKWFFNKGPRPVFDHWTYWEKFDYWAPFWGMFIIGLSGLMMWLPSLTALFLPGWVFNVATIVHGEEAFLAAVFLFTVHYFNCHWRPDKLPQDIVMFTGTMPLEEFKHEREIEYNRMVEAGELDKYLVDPPSARMTLYSQILGGVLILVGVILLILVLLGFFQQILSG